MDNILEKGTKILYKSPSGRKQEGIIIDNYIDIMNMPRYILKITGEGIYPKNSTLHVPASWVREIE